MTELTVFFDSQCPLCAAEMRRLSRWDRQGRLAYIDMQGEGFDATRYGASYAAMDAQLHAQTADGQMLVGIDAISAIYQAVGKGWLTWPLRWQWARPTLSWGYRRLARYRYQISRLLGFACPDGVCSARYR
ncbi:DUF393 domain-containing protein [Chitinimonas sp.]|uniref:thiol-disulfide oxidoreductase DCC family protein n=1 Tax=Chitinimonas sp. TaxID=1934313 RepID=UPI002F93A2C6